MSEATRSDLEEQRQYLLQSLNDLQQEREAGDIEEAEYRSLRDDYTARAAAVLRELDDLDAPTVENRSGRVRRRTGPPKQRTARSEREPRARAARSEREPRARAARSEREPRARAARSEREPQARRDTRKKSSRISPGMYVAAVVVAALVGAGFAVVAFSTGDPAPPDPETPASSQLERAHQLENQNQASEALRAYDAVLQEDPNNVEALAYRGWLLGRAGNDAPDPAVREQLLTKALESLDRAVAINPRYADARFFRGMVLFRFRNQPAPAISEFEAYLASSPPANQATAVQKVLTEARQAAAGASPAPGG